MCPFSLESQQSRCVFAFCIICRDEKPSAAMRAVNPGGVRRRYALASARRVGRPRRDAAGLTGVAAGDREAEEDTVCLGTDKDEVNTGSELPFMFALNICGGGRRVCRHGRLHLHDKTKGV